MECLPKGCEDIALKFIDFINVGEFVIMGANVPVLPLRVGNMFSSQGILLSTKLGRVVHLASYIIQDNLYLVHFFFQDNMLQSH